MTTPRVSVVIPVHEAGASTGKALESVARQTLQDIEIIVITDASQDDSAARARAALERSGLPHQVLTAERNGGPAAARNRGVVAARGEYVAFLDADSVWLPEKLARQVQLMDAHPDITLCGCQADWVDENGRQVQKLFKNLPALLPDGWKRLLWHCYVPTTCAVVRRDDLGIAPFDPALRIGEDRDLWIKLATNGTVGLVQETMVKIHPSDGRFMTRNYDLLIQDTRPMLHRHIRTFGDRLTWYDRARAIGHLNSQIGKYLCHNPASYAHGAPYLLRAALLGFRPLDNLRELLYTAPGLRTLRTIVKQHVLNRWRARAG